MHSFISGQVALLEVVVILLYGLFLKASTVDTEDLEKLLAQAVWDALNAAHISIKEAAYAMDMDESQLRKQLRAEKSQHLNLTKLFRLPFAFWMWFSPSLMSLIYRKRMVEFAQSIDEMKRSA